MSALKWNLLLQPFSCLQFLSARQLLFYKTGKRNQLFQESCQPRTEKRGFCFQTGRGGDGQTGWGYRARYYEVLRLIWLLASKVARTQTLTWIINCTACQCWLCKELFYCTFICQSHLQIVTVQKKQIFWRYFMIISIKTKRHKSKGTVIGRFFLVIFAFKKIF